MPNSISQSLQVSIASSDLFLGFPVGLEYLSGCSRVVYKLQMNILLQLYHAETSDPLYISYFVE